MREVLGKEGQSGYVHCVSGKDRSPFVIYAFLQLTYSIEEIQARAALQARVGVDGTCILKLDGANQHGPRAWLARALLARQADD